MESTFHHHYHTMSLQLSKHKFPKEIQSLKGLHTIEHEKENCEQPSPIQIQRPHVTI